MSLLSGNIRLVYDMTNAQDIGQVADTATVLETISVATGSAADQSNAFARFSASGLAEETDTTYTLSSLTVPTASGGTTTLNMSRLKGVWLKNTSATLYVLVELLISGTPETTVAVPADGLFFLTFGGDGYHNGQNGTSAITAVRVTGGVADESTASYELILSGVKA